MSNQLENKLYELYQLSAGNFIKSIDYQSANKICSAHSTSNINEALQIIKNHISEIEKLCDDKQRHFIRFYYLKDDEIGYLYDLIKLGEIVCPDYPCVGMQVALAWRRNITVDLDVAKYLQCSDRHARRIIKSIKDKLANIHEHIGPNYQLHHSIWFYLSQNNYIK
jgi:hypothetical protein